MSESIVEFRDGIPVVSSVRLTRSLGKRHADLVRTISDLVRSINERGSDFSENFVRGAYLDANGRSRPMFWITDSGFCVMRFHRKKARRVAEQVLMAFSEARAAAKKRSQALWESVLAMNGTDDGKANWTEEAMDRARDALEWDRRVTTEMHSRIMQMGRLLDQHVPDWRERVTFNKLPPPPH
jgi:Rha family phage regulatory protein